MSYLIKIHFLSGPNVYNISVMITRNLCEVYFLIFRYTVQLF
jgi:hypothetical protein